MPGAPKAASASPFEPALPGRRAWRKQQRLLRADEFAAVSQAQMPWRASRRWVAMSAQIRPLACANNAGNPCAVSSSVRFGITVSRQQARRAVARNAVRRVLREAARHGQERLVAAAQQCQLDIVLRLKAPLPQPPVATWSDVKAELRREADSLLAQLLRQLLTQSAVRAGVST